MKKFSSILAILCAAASLASAPSYAKSNMPACKGATVYAVAADKVYYTKGTTQYGHVKGGSYICEAAAKSKGYHKATSSSMSSSSMH
jgi:hypothetical protein